MTNYSQEIKTQICNMYNEGLNSTEISKITGIKPATIILWCRKAGIIRSRGPKSKISKEQYFQDILTEEQAYWLGWIIADGCVSIYNNQYSLKLHIAKKDSILIERFIDTIDSANKIQYRKESTYVSLTSKKMITDLMHLNVLPNKSGQEKFPEIAKKLRRHMIRGYFDGDGITCIGKTKRSGFCGGEEALTFIRNEVMLFPKIYNARGTKYLQFGKKESLILYNYMYKKASIFLERKKNRMNIICGEYRGNSNI